MIKPFIDNEILNYILTIEKSKDSLNRIDVPLVLSNRFRKNTTKDRPMHSYNSYGCITSINRFYHKKICEYCNNTIVEPHNFTLVNNYMLCNTCGYRGIIINAPIE